jgi:hypothetical protein
MQGSGIVVPYEPVGKPASPEHFAGRLSTVRHLLRVLPSIVLITGPEYVGRTSLLKFLAAPEAYDRWQRTVEAGGARQVVEQLRRWHFFLIDLRRVLVAGDDPARSEMFLRLMDEQLGRLRDTVFRAEAATGGREQERAFAGGGEREADLSGRIVWRLQEEPLAGKQVCMLLDSADLLMSSSVACRERPEQCLHQTIIPALVAALVEMVPGFGVVLAAGQGTIDRHELSSGSPVWARAVGVRLGPLTEREAQLLVSLAPEDAPDRPFFTPDEQDWLLREAGTHPYLLGGLCYLAFMVHREQSEMHGGRWEPLTEEERKDILRMAHQAFDPVCARIGRQVARHIWPREAAADLLYRLARALVAHRNMGVEHELGEVLHEYGMLVPHQNRPCELFVTGVGRSAGISVAAPAVSLPGGGAGRVRIRVPTGEWRVVRLSPLEYRLLAALKRAGSVEVSREALMEAGWGMAVPLSTFAQRLHQLRRKLRDMLGKDYIENVYGSGYRLQEEGQERMVIE